jgi:methylated-DNA-protein-cysteine methyltransferase-like protein
MRGRQGSGGWQRIYDVVQRIPRGRVATYGQVARLAGMPGRARQVGYALHALDEQSDVPWQRVLNAQGRVSPRGEPEAQRVQRALLEREGVVFGSAGRVDLRSHGWRPRRAKAGAAGTRSVRAAERRRANAGPPAGLRPRPSASCRRPPREAAARTGSA